MNYANYDKIDDTIFLPISKQIYNIYDFENIKLNNISICSSIFYFLSLFFLERNMKIVSSFLYLLGYIFSCVRYIKYENIKTATQYEKIFDNITFSVSNMCFLFYFFYLYFYNLFYNQNRQKNKIISTLFLVLLILFNGILLLSFAEKEEKKYNNFYEYYKKLYENNNEPIYKFYIELMKCTYNIYNILGKKKISNLGLGTYSFFVFFCILFF